MIKGFLLTAVLKRGIESPQKDIGKKESEREENTEDPPCHIQAMV